MNNISIKLDLNINGAVIIPNPAQYARIKKAVLGIVFDDVDDKGDVGLTTKRSKVAWSSQEENFALESVKAGHKFADIADQMYRRFGNKRTKASVTTHLWAMAKAKRNGKGILDVVAEGQK